MECLLAVFALLIILLGDIAKLACGGGKDY